MEPNTIYVFAVLALAIIMFVSDKVRLDLVAILVIFALVLGHKITGGDPIISAKQGVAGFGATVVLLIGGLFLVGEGLAQTGVSYAMGDKIVEWAGTGRVKLIALLMTAVAIISAFMSSTGAVAIFIPVAIRLAQRAGMKRQEVLMPLSFGALIGGMLTLIGTPPNIVVADQLGRAGLQPFEFFTFTPIGLVILALGIVYFALFGAKLLSKCGRKDGSEEVEEVKAGSILSFLQRYEIEERAVRLKINDNSGIVGKTAVDALLRTQLGVSVFGLQQAKNGSKLVSAHSAIPFSAGDVIYGVKAADLDEGKLKELGLTLMPRSEDDFHLSARELGLADLIVTQNSQLVGQNLKESNFRKRHNLGAVGVMRRGQPLEGNFAETKLEFGDQLLVAGDWTNIKTLNKRSKDFLVASLPEEIEDVVAKPHLAWVSVAVVCFMLALLVFKLVPSVIAILMASVLMVLTKCVDGKDTYRVINWQSLVLIAGMLPMATALKSSGGLEFVVSTLLAAVGDSGPYVLLAAIFIITSLFSQVISNTATSVLLAPIAIGAAQAMGVSPYPIMMGVAIAASTAFATPVASPVNMLVLEPGNYRFVDFAIVGLPLQILAFLVSLVAIPMFLPF